MNVFPDNGAGLLEALDAATGTPPTGCTCPDGLGVALHLFEGHPIAACPTHGEHPDSPQPAAVDPLAAELAAALTATTTDTEEAAVGRLLAPVDHLTNKEH